MKNRYIPAFIMLAAGLVCCVLCVVQRWPVLNSLITLVIVLLLFYIIGQIAAQIVGKVQAEHLAMIEAEKKRQEAEEQARLLQEKEYLVERWISGSDGKFTEEEAEKQVDQTEQTEQA